MIDKRFVESFLRLNNLGTNALATEIKTVLTEAHWPPEEIEEALLVHSGNEVATEAFAQKQHGQLFRPDMNWSSSKLSSLLGIDVVIDPKSFRMPTSVKEQFRGTGRNILFGLCVAVIAVAVAAGLGIGLMYFFEIGPFYTQVDEII